MIMLIIINNDNIDINVNDNIDINVNNNIDINVNNNIDINVNNNNDVDNRREAVDNLLSMTSVEIFPVMLPTKEVGFEGIGIL